MTITDVLSQVGGTIGTLGTAAASYVAAQIRSVRVAVASAKRAREGAEAAERRAAEIAAELDVIRRGIQLEVQHLRAETSASVHTPHASDPFLPGLAELHRTIEDLRRRIDECRGDVVRERGARHAMAHQLADDAREDEKQWREVHRILGEIQGQMRGLR